MRFGLHWGATVHVGRLLTAGRIEVTAIGDEVNEAAGSRLRHRRPPLASKALVERLSDEDAGALGIDPTRTRYTTLAELPTATEKARRDARRSPSARSSGARPNGVRRRGGSARSGETHTWARDCAAPGRRALRVARSGSRCG